MNLENNFPEKIEFQLLFCFFLVLYISCSPVKEEITPITEITPLKKDTVFYIQDRAYVDMNTELLVG